MVWTSTTFLRSKSAMCACEAATGMPNVEVVGIEGPNWLTDQTWAVVAVTVVVVWRQLGFNNNRLRFGRGWCGFRFRRGRCARSEHLALLWNFSLLRFHYI